MTNKEIRQRLDLFAIAATDEGYVQWAKAMADASERIRELEEERDAQKAVH